MSDDLIRGAAATDVDLSGVDNGYEAENPVMPYLRQDRIPHIWCPGCGIGTSVNCLARALTDSELDLDQVAIVSGIGCTGRVAGYMNLDSFHTTHGRPIPFATGLKLANPNLKVIVYSGDGDLFAIGGNHFVHAARRNMDLMVVCINNFTYGMTGGQVAPTTPLGPTQTTMPYGNFENSFNLPFLADACGAVYVARWTVYHVKQLAKAMLEGLKKKGFVFIEAMSPCPTLYSRRNRLGDGVDQLKYYKEKSTIKNGADTKEVALGFQSEIVVGKFVDRERPTWLDSMNDHFATVLGERYTRYGVTNGQN
jgi:2-oxoglutarate ferredoxin oxidoreductase subunit beta